MRHSAFQLVEPHDLARGRIDQQQAVRIFDRDHQTSGPRIEVEPVRPAILPQVDRADSLALPDVDDRNRVAALARIGHPQHPVIGYVEVLAVRRQHELVRMFAHGDRDDARAVPAIEPDAVRHLFADQQIHLGGSGERGEKSNGNPGMSSEHKRAYSIASESTPGSPIPR